MFRHVSEMAINEKIDKQISVCLDPISSSDRCVSASHFKFVSSTIITNAPSHPDIRRINLNFGDSLLRSYACRTLSSLMIRENAPISLMFTLSSVVHSHTLSICLRLKINGIYITVNIRKNTSVFYTVVFS